VRRSISTVRILGMTGLATAPLHSTTTALSYVWRHASTIRDGPALPRFCDGLLPRAFPVLGSLGESPCQTIPIPEKTPDTFRCPSCASLDVQCVDIRRMIGRRDYDVLIVCMPCDAVNTIPAAHT
jgi:hypothetical protein